jgi:hypothetical protein
VVWWFGVQYFFYSHSISRMKNITKIYFTLVSLVSIVGLAVALGITLYNLASSRIITDEEFVLSRAVYQFQTCELPDAAKMTGKPGEVAIQRTPTEIQSCKARIRSEILTQRHFETKKSMIGGVSWAIVSLILFLFHYPMMIKKSHEDA